MGTVTRISCWCYRDLGAGASFKLIIVKASDLTIVTNGISNAGGVPSGANAAAATQVDLTFATAPVLAASTDYFLMMIHNDSDWAVYLNYDAGTTNQEYVDSSNNYTTPTNPTDAVPSGYPDTKVCIWVTYTPAVAGGVISPKRTLLGVGT